MANNPFIGGVNPPDTALIGGGISQTGALSGQLNSRRTEPLISLRGGEVARVTFGNGLVFDPFNVWVNTATSGGLLTGAGVRESITPSVAPTGDVRLKGGGPLHFPGDFSAAFLFRMGPTGGRVIYQDGSFNSAGYLITAGNTNINFIQSGAGVSARRIDGDTVGAAVGKICLVCVGVSGSTTMAKLNLRTLVSGAATTYVQATGDAALGNTAAGGTGNILDGEIYEAWISTLTPSDALFTSIANE